jgi:hypothetical protein
MAGGIFVDQPFHPNVKCIIFAVGLMVSYWFLPNRNPFLLPLIFIVGYIAMAWYDHLYNCDLKLYSGTSIGPNTIDTWGKPQRRTYKNIESHTGAKLLEDQETAYKKNTHLFHVIFIAPILIYVGIKSGLVKETFLGNIFTNNNGTSKYIYQMIMGLALITVMYHGGRLFVPRETTNCKKGDPEERSYLIGVYLLHLLAVVPLLVYVGYYGNNSNKSVWLVLLLTGIITKIYHLFRYFYPRKTKQCK